MSEHEDRVYTEREVLSVLRRAADRQAREGTERTQAAGSSRAELERIAEEVGIDPRHVAAALAELAIEGVAEDHRGQSRWLGAPPEYSVERIVPGTLTLEGWETLVGALNSEFKQSIPGVVSGRFRTWHWKHDLGSVHFSAVQAPEGVRLRLDLHIDNGLIAGLVPTVIAWFALASLLFSADSLRPWLSMVLSAAALVGLATAFRASAASWWRKDRRRTARLMDRLVESASVAPLAAPVLASTETDAELHLRITPDASG